MANRDRRDFAIQSIAFIVGSGSEEQGIRCLLFQAIAKAKTP